MKNKNGRFIKDKDLLGVGGRGEREEQIQNTFLILLKYRFSFMILENVK